jgi:hypothetical protein
MNDFETHLRTFSGLSKDQAFPCGFYDFFGHGLRLIDLQNRLDLHQQAVNDAKVASRNAHNVSQSLLVGKIIHADMHAQMVPALFEQPSGLILREHAKLGDETDARIELRKLLLRRGQSCWCLKLPRLRLKLRQPPVRRRRSRPLRRQWGLRLQHCRVTARPNLTKTDAKIASRNIVTQCPAKRKYQWKSKFKISL